MLSVVAGVPAWRGFNSAESEDPDSGTRASASYGDLTGPAAGPEITLTVSTLGLVILEFGSRINNSVTTGIAQANISVDGGAPNNENAVGTTITTVQDFRTGLVLRGLAAGAHTFKMEYLSSSGTGTFSRRRVSGVAL